MSKIDLSRFKKVKSGPNHTVMRHPKGHEITIFHKDLSKPLKKQLDDLPHYKDGGVIDQGVASGISGAFGNPQSNDVNTSINRAESAKKKNDAQMNQDINSQTNTRTAYAQGGKVDETPMAVEGGTAIGNSNEAPSFDYADTSVAANKAADVAMQSPAPTSTQQDIAQAVDSGPAPLTPPTDISKLVDAHNALVNHVTSQPQSPMSQSMTQPQTQSGQPAQAIQPGGSLTKQYTDAANSQIQAIQGQGQNLAANEAQNARVYGQQSEQMQKLHNDMDALHNHIHQQFEQTAQAVEAGHIDPNHWWNSKSTGGKIATAIGMILGGLGGGAGGHPEQAVNIVDGFINRDIDAQKAELGKKENLLGKYMEMYNSLPAAEAAARLTMQAGFEGQIKQQAAKLGSQNAVLAAQQAIGALRQQAVQNLPELAKGQMMMGLYGSMNQPQSPATGEEQAYQNQMQKMRILNPDLGKDMENKYLPGVGASRVPVPDKLREDLTLRKDLSDKMAQLEVFAKNHQGTITDRAVVNEGKAMAAQVQDSFRSAHQQGVFKPAEAEFVNSIISHDPTSFFAESRTLPGYRKAREFNDQTIKQYYKSYGIKPFKGGSDTGGQTSEGQTGTSKSGKPIVFKQGQWVYQ